MKFLSTIVLYYNKLRGPIFTTGSVLAFLVLIFSTYVLISVTYTQLKLADEPHYTNVSPNDSDGHKLDSVGYEDPVLKFIGFRKKVKERDRYERQMTIIKDSAIFLVTIFTLVLTFYSARKARKEISESHGIQMIDIVNPGDEIKILLKHYKGAHKVTVFSGDFSWINENDEMTTIITTLSDHDKLLLISSQKQEVLSKTIGPPLLPQLLSKKQLSFDNHNDLRCSWIKHIRGYTLIYKTGEIDAEGGLQHEKLCVVIEKEDTKYLLDVMNSLIANAKAITG